MLDNIRYEIGCCFMKLGDKYLQNGKYEKAFKNIKRGVCIIPLSKELTQFGKSLKQLAYNYTN